MPTNSFEGGQPREKIGHDVRRQLENSVPPALRKVIEDTETLDRLSKNGKFSFTVFIDQYDLEPREAADELVLLASAWDKYITIESVSERDGVLTVRLKLAGES